MAGRNVADLVADHSHEFGLGIQVGHDAARDVDVPAGKSERVHRGVVHDAECPRQAGPLGASRKPRAEALDVLLQPLVGIQANRRGDVLVHLAAHFDLLRLADQRELPLARDRVGGAADCRGRPEGDAPAEDGSPHLQIRHRAFPHFPTGCHRLFTVRSPLFLNPSRQRVASTPA
jgi:hypothetical protein